MSVDNISINSDMPIEYLGLRNGTLNALKKAGLFKVADVIDKSDYELLNLRSFGTQALIDLKQRLAVAKSEGVGPSISFNNVPYVTDDRLTLLNILEKRTLNDNDYTVKFVDEAGVHRQDMLIREAPISIRIRNSLRLAGITQLTDIVNCGYVALSQIRNLGEKSFAELFEYMKAHTVITFSTLYCKNMDIKTLAQVLYDDLNENMECIQYDYLVSRVEKCIDQISDRLHDIDADKFLSDKEIMSVVCNDMGILETIHMVSKYVAASFPSGFDYDDFVRAMPKSAVSAELCQSEIDLMLENELISHYKKGYIFNYDGLMDYVASMDDKRKHDIFLQKLNGETLDSISEKYSVTKERIRQIVKDIVTAEMPSVYEDRYIYWFEKYDTSKADFCDIFRLEPYVYEYLDLLTKKGTEDILNMRYDEYVTENMKNMLNMIAARNHIIVCGKEVKRNRWDIIRELMRANHKDYPCENTIVYDEYHQFCVDNGLADIDVTDSTSKRSFFARLEDHDWVVCSYRNLVRFYDTAEFDVEKLVETVDFSRYRGYTISSLKIFQDQQDIMKKFGIKGPYELHSLLKKHSNRLPSYVNMIRMPLIEIDSMGRAEQVVQFLEKVAPVSYMEFGVMFANEYGMDKNTVVANWLYYVSPYLCNGVYIKPSQRKSNNA